VSFPNQEVKMSEWKDRSEGLKARLRLRTDPIAYKKLDRSGDLDEIQGLVRWSQGCTFCQVPYLARVMGMTVGFTPDDKMLDRCKRLHGLLATDEATKKQEAAMLSRTWMPSEAEASKQQEDYPLIPPGEAIVVSPLDKASFEPDVISIYGNPAQIMMLMCGLQKLKYERFAFHFIGEGACADSIAQCYTSGKPALAIPCYGERALGQVADDEIVLALPPAAVDRALEGLDMLEKVGFRYPIAGIGGVTDPIPILATIYQEAV
jgi:uncharacterized protein (DUF169 family)